MLTGSALLSPLGDYGGPTQTMVPLASSPVRDQAGSHATAPNPNQRPDLRELAHRAARHPARARQRHCAAATFGLADRESPVVVATFGFATLANPVVATTIGFTTLANPVVAATVGFATLANPDVAATFGFATLSDPVVATTIGFATLSDPDVFAFARVHARATPPKGPL